MIVLLTFLSCIKPLNLKTALDQDNCIESLRAKIEESDCVKLSYMIKNNGSDSVIRCHKDDKDRKNKWDTYAFRLVYSDIPVPAGHEAFAKRYTVCLDSEWRIEAYPPRILK